MFQLRRILFPVDFSPRCRGAAVYVEALAGRFDAELILLHVVEAAYNSALEDLRGTRREDFEKFFDKSLKHLRVKTLVEHGEAAESILALAERVHADLIVLGARNASFWLTHIEHGLTPDLLAAARCPVMTVC